MSRIGQTLRPALVRASAAGAVPLTEIANDVGAAPLQSAAAVLVILGLDAGVCLGAPFLAHLLASDAPEGALVVRVAVLLLLLTIGGSVAAGAYRSGMLFRTREQIAAVLRGAFTALAVVGLAAWLLADPAGLPPIWAGTASVLLLGGLTLERLAVGKIMTGSAGRRFAPRTVIVGSGLAGTRLLRLLRQLDDRSLRIVGIVDDHGDVPDGYVEGVPLLGPVARLHALVRRGLVDEVVLALPWAEERRILDIIDRLSDCPVHVRLAPDLISYHFPRSARFDLHGHAMLHVAERPISGWNSVIKRGEDIAVGVLALVLCAIPMALIALAIRLDSPGPVLFRQKRTGFNNAEFEMLKFRTMHHGAAEYAIRHQATRNDPRVTRVGAILRRTSLDELPQILNVLRGDMSVVGPRPHAPGTRAGSRPFEQVVDRYAARHRVKPGLTGLAQVRGLRGETRTEDKLIRRVESDLEYIETWSVWLDLAVLVRTMFIVLRMKNAY